MCNATSYRNDSSIALFDKSRFKNVLSVDFVDEIYSRRLCDMSKVVPYINNHDCYMSPLQVFIDM